jgi:hypothetical protein
MVTYTRHVDDLAKVVAVEGDYLVHSESVLNIEGIKEKQKGTKDGGLAIYNGVSIHTGNKVQ